MRSKILPLQLPIIQAPMAGGITTPQLVAAVSNAGALGSFAGGYLSPEEIRSAIRKIRLLTSKPFNVNLFVPPSSPLPVSHPPKEVLNVLASFWEGLSKEPFDCTFPLPPSFEEQVEVLLDEEVPVFSFAFGTPSAHIIERFHQKKSLVLGTATTLEEAHLLEKAGVDAIVCQGQEAGGHRGGFSSEDPLLGLIPFLSLANSHLTIPFIAAGGIMNGRSIRAALFLGAEAVQMGTAFITTEESGACPSYQEALLDRKNPATRFSKAWSGKAARAIPNKLMDLLESLPILPYPHQHFVTQKLRQLAAKQDFSPAIALFAGQGYPLCRKMSAENLLQELAQELSRS